VSLTWQVSSLTDSVSCLITMLRTVSTCVIVLAVLGWTHSLSDDATENDPREETIKCYSCDSTQGACDETTTGEQIDCEARLGCTIKEDKDIFTRGCSMEETADCTMNGDTKTCNCQTELCNKDWTSAGAEDKMQCYSCDSNEGECDLGHVGSPMYCKKEAGCIINTDVNDGTTLFMRGCADIEDAQGCVNDDDALTCRCMDPLCNAGWESAGSSTGTPSKDTIKCYSCDSSKGACDETTTGDEQIDCEAKFGCTIKEDKDIFVRRCSISEDADCTMEGDTKTCNCQTELCNKDWTTAGAEEKMQCYSCDSNEGECDLEHIGSPMYCKKEAGCIINKDVSDGKTVFMRGCADIEDDQGCVNDDDAHTCRCMDELCNKGWESAGSSTGTPNTTPQVPKIKCYKCDSTAAEQECTEDSYGTEVDCPDTFGCTISKTIAGDGSQGMMRDCSSEKDTICDTVDNPSDVGGTTQFCNCNTELCNANWATAGSTSEPTDGTTKSTTTTTTTTSSIATVATTHVITLATITTLLALV